MRKSHQDRSDQGVRCNIFDLWESLSSDLMQTLQINITQYINIMYGGDIMGKLETKNEFVALAPEYPQSAKGNKFNMRPC